MMTDRRPTLAAVARRAGVSPSTASLAFNSSGPVAEATRDRVLAAARELGYAGPDPRARSLRRGRSGIVGVVLEESLREAFRDPMNLLMLDGIADVTGQEGNSLLLLNESGTGSSSLMDAPIDAVVLFGCSPSVDDKVDVLLQRGIPVVAIEGNPHDGVLDINLDNRAASRSLAEHLRSLGHSRVAVVALELDGSRRRQPLTDELVRAATSHTARERALGVAEIYPGVGGVMTLGSTHDEGRAAGLALLAESGRTVALPAADRPTAIIAQSDVLAAGVIRAARELGLSVPGDLSVVGFDGVRLDDASLPELATMVQPGFEKGRAAGRGVLDRLAGRPGQPVSFTSAFRRGATTAPPHA